MNQAVLALQAITARASHDAILWIDLAASLRASVVPPRALSQLRHGHNREGRRYFLSCRTHI